MRPVPLTNGNLINADQAAQLLGKSARTVRAYTTRGLLLANGERWYLPVAGLDHRGVQLFNLADIRTAAQAVQERGRSNKRVLVAA
ncbi:hypothetical protein [Nocardiopsis sp. FR26]|uniref:hypothetical protein n=1 Tax=Nocardiopsis sp. FR26 TaxID=2605987 RepID=UPI0013579323|nr:hypothetical protein [Nocardiopsis sp. FR26]